MNQLNPDPQGGESNMIFVHKEGCPCLQDDPPCSKDCGLCTCGEPEGATTQSTPACDELRDSLSREFECGYDQLDPIQKILVDRRVEQLSAPADQPRNPLDDMDDPASMEGSYRPQFAAQPVPSAGSKPQEEGGLTLRQKIEANLKATGDWRGRTPEEIARHHEATDLSQPVADGGGLPPLPKERFWFTDAEVLSHLEVSEYQETQIRGRLMHMTTGEKYALYRAVIDTAKRKGFVSPEGSSR